MHFFYGKPINRKKELIFVKRILQEFEDFAVDENLKKQVHKRLSEEKEKGNLLSPFSVQIIQKDSFHPSYVEIILESKV